ncbi:hypothetical protein LOTGIDRAFT_163656 [Lottia gigantea]|uniref:Laminin G domain-containing protein n=1 Tax=Lottia gigantea TaxID=225164 RepID=V4BP76_LOTGI|nr:hypothetical protein LOTGIDRAFT_163656 [Lottia gigantea]ESO90774.1 hypothetical protein LOTGIDRAFT_163656 [Lottia gigantea]
MEGNHCQLPPCPGRIQNAIVVNHLWPLDEKVLAFDTETNTGSEHKCFRFGKNHPSLPNSAIYIDGSPLSRITVKLNSNEIDEAFTLTSGVFIRSQSSGSFLKIVDMQGQPIFEVQISGRDIAFNAYFSNTTKCASLSMTNAFTTNTWYVVGIQRDVSANLIGIVINENLNNTSDMCGTFGYSGELFVLIGNSNRQLPGYRSDVRCLIMFGDPGSDIMTAFQDKCLDVDSNLMGEYFSPNTSTCGILPILEKLFLVYVRVVQLKDLKK